MDLRVINNKGKFKFEVYRKPTAIQRTITTTLVHTTAPKMAAYNSIVRTYLLTKAGFERKKKNNLDKAEKRLTGRRYRKGHDRKTN